MKKIVFFFSIIFLLLFASLAKAQFQELLRKILPSEIPLIDRILGSEPVLTTSIADAITEVPFLDDFNPRSGEPMTVLPRTSDGGFTLNKPGNYLFLAESYCLQAGTYAPGRERGGDGYLYAPLKGPRADIIKNVLKRTYLYPDIPQRDVQTLLWAILARTKIQDMSPHMQNVASKLLTREEIFKINGGALGLIPEELLYRALERVKMPPTMQKIMMAEAKIRNILSSATYSYEELERIAVLHGEIPFQKGDRAVPIGRWSFHPDGYFLRFFFNGYQKMLVELYVPEKIMFERDNLGRIISISVPNRTEKRDIEIKGRKILIPEIIVSRLEIIYDDRDKIIFYDKSFVGYPIKSVKFQTLKTEKVKSKEVKDIQREWNYRDWTFLGVPSGEPKEREMINRLSNLQERYRNILNHKQEILDLNEGVNKLTNKRKKISQDNLKEIIELGSLAMVMHNIVNLRDSERRDWLHGPVEVVKMAWAYALSKALKEQRETVVFNPAEDPVPGKSGAQREGGSPRPKSPFNDCINQYEECKKDLGFDQLRCLFDCMYPCEDISEEELKKRCFENCGKNCEKKYESEKSLCNSQAAACIEATTRGSK